MRKAKSNVAKARKVSVLVTVDDSNFDFHNVAKSLEQEGLEQTDKLPLSGIVGGIVEPEKISKLKLVQGVQAIELAPTAHAY